MNRTLLIELGCEELPSNALVGQAEMLAAGLERGLTEAGLVTKQSSVRWLATPRRLAVLVTDVLDRQADRKLDRKGPAESAAFDADGKPTRAAEGFARSVGLTVDQLERIENDQGRWLFARVDQPGQALEALLPEMLDRTVRDMAGARSMRWSDRSERFLRPVRWLVGMHGDRTLEFELFGLSSSSRTRGHRVHAPGEHSIPTAEDYPAVLEQAFVLADFDRRRARIVEQVRAEADSAGLEVGLDEGLIDEVAGLVEWPVAVTGSFDPAFLEVPPEALISAMRVHQKTFPLFDDAGLLANRFIAVSNIESTDPSAMTHGFERVIRPRLADARFFYELDRKHALDQRFDRLGDMAFQEQLGSLADKSARLEQLGPMLAPALGADPETVARAARLCKCDLLTEMVGEFPELQGTMGRYYAEADGEPEAVAAAIESHYRPRHAGDGLAQDPAGLALALADRLDTLVGVFAAGKKPRGGKDPFALRRAAQGVVRILDQAGCEQTLSTLIGSAARVLEMELGDRLPVSDAACRDVEDFIEERLRAWLSDQGLQANTLHAVAAGRRGSVIDFVARARAVEAFADDPNAASLIAANKRASNLLKQADIDSFEDVDASLFEDDAERDLAEAVESAGGDVAGALEALDYPAALARLAKLRPAVDRFFENVMVMADSPAVRGNRLALLGRLRALFLQIADVALLGRA